MSITSNKMDAIVLLGDSITEFSWGPSGLASTLAQRYVRKLDVVNRGFSGYSTSMVLPIAREILIPSASSTSESSQKIAAMTLWLGANDAVLFDSPSRQAVPVELYASNLRELLTILPADTPQLLITPPLIQPTRWAADRQLEKEDRSEENTARFAQAARDVVAQLKKEGHNVVLVDIWEAMVTYRSNPANDVSSLLIDGLHLSASGYELVNSLLIPLLDELLGGPPETIAQPYPDWKAALDVEGVKQI